MTLAEMLALVERELEALDEDRRATIRRRLVRPELRDLDWNYGEAAQRYPCWVVAIAGSVRLVYCEAGFGPAYPWGFVLDGDGMGMDSQWHGSLRHAAVGAGWIEGRADDAAP